MVMYFFMWSDQGALLKRELALTVKTDILHYIYFLCFRYLPPRIKYVIFVLCLGIMEVD